MDQIDEYLSTLADDEKTIFLMIASYAFSLGYKVRRDKSKTPGYTFTHSKVKKHILRFSSYKGRPIIKIKFFASQEYSKFFHEAIRTVIDEYDYKYTGCYGCGNCKSTEGYKYKYPDGREYYRCGTELIEITDIKNAPVTELLDLFKRQHDYYVSDLRKG